ncbi:MAG TPA: DUF4332 domain-containing protein [Thermoanaerobaculia bacterium]|nr:DUF4332 domain-containing protein [Thermoanaerobaculia bacterium]
MSDRTYDLRLEFIRLLNKADLSRFEQLWPEQPQRLRERLVEANTSLRLLEEIPSEDLINRLIEVAKERRFGVVLMSDLPGDDDTPFWQAVSLIEVGRGEIGGVDERYIMESELPGGEVEELAGDDDTSFWNNDD